jgi:hypothetical protein
MRGKVLPWHPGCHSATTMAKPTAGLRISFHLCRGGCCIPHALALRGLVEQLEPLIHTQRAFRRAASHCWHDANHLSNWDLLEFIAGADSILVGDDFRNG